MDVVGILYEVRRFVLDVRIGITIRLSPVGLHVDFRTRSDAGKFCLLGSSIVVVRMDVVGILYDIFRYAEKVRVSTGSGYGCKTRLVLDVRIGTTIRLSPVGLYIDLGARRDAGKFCLLGSSIVVVRMDVVGILYEVFRLVLYECIGRPVTFAPVGLHVDLGTGSNSVQLHLVGTRHGTGCTRTGRISSQRDDNVSTALELVAVKLH